MLKKGVSDATYKTMTCVVAYQVVSINHQFICLFVHSFVATGNPRSLICIGQCNLEFPTASRSHLKLIYKPHGTQEKVCKRRPGEKQNSQKSFLILPFHSILFLLTNHYKFRYCQNIHRDANLFVKTVNTNHRAWATYVVDWEWLSNTIKLS